MASIPRDDVSQLFEETQHKTWPGFRRVLEQHKSGELTGIDSPVIDRLLTFTQRMEEMHRTFPVSEEQLQRLLSEELESLAPVR